LRPHKKFEIVPQKDQPDPIGRRPLTPGPHVVRIDTYFNHFGLVRGLSIDAGEAEVKLDAVAGVRYAATGQVSGPDSAEVWVVDLKTGTPGSNRSHTFLHNNPQGPTLAGFLFTLDRSYWLNQLITDRKVALGAAGMLVLEEALSRTYVAEPASFTDWAEAPGPTILVSSHDLEGIKVALVAAATKDGFTVDADLNKGLQLSRPVTALQRLAQTATGSSGDEREFENFIFEETADGNRIYASRSAHTSASKDGNARDPVMNKRNFEKLKDLLDSVKRTIEKSKSRTKGVG